MKRKEDGKQTPIPEPASPFILSTGKWDKNISWEFIIAPEKPDRNLYTAVCCITTFNRKLLLVRNKGKWEFPSGIIEDGETEEQAAIREVQEETGAKIDHPQFFGYRKLIVNKPVERANKQGTYYPFPISYVIYLHADAISILDATPDDDIQEVRKTNYEEAKELLIPESQYGNILDYLRDNRLIDIS